MPQCKYVCGGGGEGISRGDLPMPQLPYIPDNSSATRSLREKTWTVVLRCHACNRRFAVANVTIDRLALAPQVTHCVHCGAQPRLAEAGNGESRLHVIIDMRQ